jgi:large subunit ribosomal protein L25
MSREEIVLTAHKREAVGKGPARRVRSAGDVPVIMYGHGRASVPLRVNARELAPYVHHTGLLKLKVEGRSRSVSAIIKDVQYDMLRGAVRHVDFQEVRADEVITATIPIEHHGTPAGEAHGGMLDQILHEIDIRCAVNRLPETIRVEVAGLGLDEALYVRDLPLPEGATADAEPDQIVFTVTLPRVEAEAGAAEEAEEAEEAEGEEAEDEGGPAAGGAGQAKAG